MTALVHVLNHNLHTLLHGHALPVIAFIVFFEELGFPSPLPGELMLLLAGVQAAQGTYPLWLVLLVLEVAALLGGSGLYAVCRRVGRPLVLRYGRFLHLQAKTLDRAEGLIHRHGFWAVAVGRMIPGVCIVVPIAAGLLDMPYGLFLPAFSIGVLGYIGALTLTGYLVGPFALTLFERITLPVGGLVTFGILAVLLVAAHRLAKRIADVPRTAHEAMGVALFTGGFAGLAGLLAANGLIDIVRWTRHVVTGTSLLAATGVGTGWRLLLGWPFFLVVASGLGALDNVLLSRHLHFKWRMALLTIVPLLLTVLAVYPIAEHHLVRWTGPRDILLLAVEAARWTGFGVALHLVLPYIAGERPVERTAAIASGDGHAVAR